MQVVTLLLLRVSLGLLMVIWGLDKLVNVEHGQAVSNTFYFGLLSAPTLLTVLGALQVLLGVLIVFGFLSRFTYPLLIIITGVTLAAVWKSVIDPWGWVFEGANALFYPSLIIFAGALVLAAFRDHDRIAIDHRGGSE